jgi:hypothetical protein
MSHIKSIFIVKFSSKYPREFYAICVKKFQPVKLGGKEYDMKKYKIVALYSTKRIFRVFKNREQLQG